MTAAQGALARPLRRRVGPIASVRHGLVLAWRNVVQLKHSPEKLADVILLPVTFTILFLFVFGGAVAGSTHAYLQQLLPGMIAQMALFTSGTIGAALCEDIQKGVFDRFRSLPIARSAPLVGLILGATVRFCVTMVVVVVIGTVLGFRFQTGPLSVLAAFGLAYLFYLAFCWITAVIGLIAATPQSVQAYTLVLAMPIGFGSSILVEDTDTMPGWLQSWVEVNPITYFADTVRALTVGGSVGEQGVYAVAWAVGIIVVTFPVAVWIYLHRI